MRRTMAPPPPTTKASQRSLRGIVAATAPMTRALSPLKTRLISIILPKIRNQSSIVRDPFRLFGRDQARPYNTLLEAHDAVYVPPHRAPPARRSQYTKRTL